MKGYHFFAFVFLALLFVGGCSSSTTNFSSHSTMLPMLSSSSTTTTLNSSTKSYALFKDNTVKYGVLVEKPNPCYQVAIKPSFLDTTLYLDIQLLPPEKGTMCAQVITPELITGEVITGTKPAKVIIRKNNQEKAVLVVTEE